MKKEIIVTALFICMANQKNYSQSSQYEVGTWQGFTDAAVTYTFDDLSQKQIPVAVPLLDKYGLKATFYPIVDQNPNWIDLRKLAANGHEIGSHTVTHPTTIKGIPTEEDELKNSKAEIEKQIPDNKCITIAYPYCIAGTESLVSKYYIAGRCCQGQIESKSPDFYTISSIAVGSETTYKSGLSLNTKVNEAATAKGWCVFLVHGIDSDGGYSQIASSALDSNFTYVSENKSKFWVSSFSNVARYKKERNAATVQEISAQEKSIILKVTDSLDDSIYNYPLSIRRALPAEWSSASVSQKGSPVPSSIVTDGPTKYVMFDVIPDNGEITISIEAAPASGFVAKNGALKRMGAKIVGAHGNPVQAAGPSFYWSIWGGEKYYNDAVVSKIASSWNATLIRAAIAVENTNGYLVKPAQQLTHAKTVVDAAIKNGIYVLVDWHDHNANLHIPQAKEFFSQMAETYKNSPNIIWEIWNEPDLENGSGTDGADTWDDIRAYADSIIPVIKQYSSNLIVVGTPNWSADPASAASKPLTDSNVAYTLHFYSGTHGASVRSNAETAMSKGAALFITEFGTVNTLNIHTDTTLYLKEANTWLDWADSKGLSWANWSLSSIPEACSVLKPGASTSGNWSDSDLTPSGMWLKDRLMARSSGQNTDSVKIYTFTEGNGSVTTAPNVKQVKKGTAVSFTAVPAQGWEFKCWSDGSTSTDNPLTLTINQNTSLIATFVPGAGTNMVKSGDFSDPSEWSSWIDDKANAGKITFANEQINVTITKADTVNWKIQISQGGIALDSGVPLIMTFDAWSSCERKLFAGLSTATTYHFQGGTEVVLSASKKTYTIEMTPDSSTTDGIVQFCCGASLLPVYIDNVSLVKKNGSSAITHYKYKNSTIVLSRLKDRVYWTAPSNNSSIMLMDVSGRVLLSETKTNPITLANIPKGFYLFIVKSNEHRQVFKIVK
jgi:aryl-phospho-beta-D-glucosidase BglC (GH1 family)